MRYYPIHLDLRNLPVLVVGGGAIAQGKAQQLISAGARVRVVSPTLTARLGELVNQGVIEYRCGNFIESDLTGVVLVISATSDQTVNEKVAQTAVWRRVLCNVVDQPKLCSFITPALVTRGELQISISTGGGSPVVAQRIKREIAELIGEEYGELLELSAAMRAEAKKLISDFNERRDLLRAFVESEAIELLRAGRRREAEQLAHKLLVQVARPETTSAAI
jgi:siroheme synthase-like protein